MMKILTGLLAAILLVGLFPASSGAWGNPDNSRSSIWNVKKPYNSWWGHCNSCRSCSGGICGLNSTTSTGGNSYAANSIGDGAINNQINCSDGKCTPAYAVSIGIIDCTSSNSLSVTVIDCTNSTSFYSAPQRTLVYYQNTAVCSPGGLCQR